MKKTLLLIITLLVLNSFILAEEESSISNPYLEEQLRNQGFSTKMFKRYNKMQELIDHSDRKGKKKEKKKKEKKKAPIRFIEKKKKPFDSGSFESVSKKDKRDYRNSNEILQKVKKGFYFKPLKRILVPGVNIYGNSGMVKTTNAYTLPRGKFVLSMGLLYHTVKNDDKGEKIQFAANEHADISHFPITASFGLLDNLELSCILPIRSFNVDADQIDSNKISENGIGDINFRLKLQLPLVQSSDDTKFAAGLGLKFPTGQEGEKFGSTGKADVEIFTAISQRMGVLTANLELGYIFMGDAENEPVEVDNNKFNYNFGFSFGRNEKLQFMAEINGEEWGDYGGKIDFVPGIRSVINKNFLVNIGLPISLINNQRFGYNFQLVCGAGVMF